MTRIFIADDHQMIIDGLKSLLAGEESIKVVGEALNGKGVLDFLAANKIDIVLLDINMPGYDGIETTREIKKLHQDVKVLILSMHDTRDFIESVMNAGAEGYILKNTGRDELLAAIGTIKNDGYYYGSDILKTLATKGKKNIEETPQLSKRELEIIKLISQEYTTQEIADKLFISTHTVDTHRKNLLAKLNVRNTAGLVKFALQNKLD